MYIRFIWLTPTIIDTHRYVRRLTGTCCMHVRVRRKNQPRPLYMQIMSCHVDLASGGCATRIRMAYRFRVALLLLFLWKYTSCQTDGGPSCQCDEVLANLRELREATFSTTSAECGRVLCVNLTQGTEYIAEYSANEINNVSVIISGNDSVVQCMPPDDGELPLSDYTRFPLIFSNSSFVVIEGVHFKGCVRPIRFEYVTRLEFVMSSFR